MKPACALFAALAIARAQINLQITPVPDAATSRVLDKSLTKVLSLYLVTAENQSPEDVMLMESLVLKRMQGITMPVDHMIVEMLIAEGDKNSLANRGGRIVADLARIASFLTAGGIVALGHTGLDAALSVHMMGPYFVDRLRGLAPPVRANYSRIAWTGPIVLHTGETAVRYVFAAKERAKINAGSGSGSIEYQFAIPTDTLKRIPVAQ